MSLGPENKLHDGVSARNAKVGVVRERRKPEEQIRRRFENVWL